MLRINNSGILVAFCGVDGSGKTTHAQLLNDWCKTKLIPAYLTKVELTATYAVRKLAYERFGDHAAYHPHIPAVLREFVMACDLVSHFDNVIRKQLSNGKCVIWDRGPGISYKAYSLAYGIRNEWLDLLYDAIPPPDITFFLDLPIQVSNKRLKDRQFPKIQLDENPRFLAKVSSHLRRLAEEYQNVEIIDANNSVDKVQNIIREKVLNYFSLKQLGK